MRGPSISSGRSTMAMTTSRDGTIPWAAASRASRCRSHRSQHRVGDLLRRRSDPLGRADEDGALGQSLATHARFAAERHEVSLPLDASAGHRSVRPQHRLLRLPGHLQDHEWRAELVGHQPRSLDAGSQPHRFFRRNCRRQSRPVLRRSCLRDRAFEGAEGPDLGRHQRRQGLVHEGWRRPLERRDQEHPECRRGERSPAFSLRSSMRAPRTSRSTLT